MDLKSTLDNGFHFDPLLELLKKFLSFGIIFAEMGFRLIFIYLFIYLFIYNFI